MGTYKFQSLKTSEDGTFSITVMDQVTRNGTWEKKDGEYYFSAGNEPISAKLEGSRLIFSQDSVEFTLKK